MSGKAFCWFPRQLRKPFCLAWHVLCFDLTTLRLPNSPLSSLRPSWQGNALYWHGFGLSVASICHCWYQEASLELKEGDGKRELKVGLIFLFHFMSQVKLEKGSIKYRLLVCLQDQGSLPLFWDVLQSSSHLLLLVLLTQMALPFTLQYNHLTSVEEADLPAHHSWELSLSLSLCVSCKNWKKRMAGWMHISKSCEMKMQEAEMRDFL